MALLNWRFTTTEGMDSSPVQRLMKHFSNPSLFFLCDSWKMLERVTRLFQTCEKNPFMNNRNNFFYEIDLKTFFTRYLDKFNNQVFFQYSIH